MEDSLLGDQPLLGAGYGAFSKLLPQEPCVSFT